MSVLEEMEVSSVLLVEGSPSIQTTLGIAMGKPVDTAAARFM